MYFLISFFPSSLCPWEPGYKRRCRESNPAGTVTPEIVKLTLLLSLNLPKNSYSPATARNCLFNSGNHLFSFPGTETKQLQSLTSSFYGMNNFFSVDSLPLRIGIFFLQFIPPFLCVLRQNLLRDRPALQKLRSLISNI